MLAAERRRQGKSVNDVVDGTKIRSRLIDALEGDHYDRLPSPAYVKGYIQSYARFLEIPVEPLLDQYRLEATNVERPASPTDRYLDIPHETLVPSKERQHAIPRKVWVATAAVLIVVVLLICGLTWLFGGNATPPLPASTKGVSSGEVTASPGAEPTTTGTTFKLRITAMKGSASWVHVVVDGLTGYEGTLQGGDSREFLVTGTAVVKAGKPSALTVTRDGVTVKIPSGGKTPQLTLSATK